MTKHSTFSKAIDRLDSFIREKLKIPFRLYVRDSRMVSPTALTYVMIHGLADTGEIWKPLTGQLPDNVNFISLDLLGHGKSRQSKSKVYSAEYQARNVIATCLSSGFIGNYVFIGHSFGSMVAVECAKRYPRTKRIILCAPPLYEKPHGSNPESILFKIYRQSIKYPQGTVAMYNLINKLGVGGPSRTTLSKETFPAFKETLQSGIMNQRIKKHLLGLNIPVNIVYGRFDPLMVSKNIESIAKDRSNIQTKIVLSDHALRGTMIRAILDVI